MSVKVLTRDEAPAGEDCIKEATVLESSHVLMPLGRAIGILEECPKSSFRAVVNGDVEMGDEKRGIVHQAFLSLNAQLDTGHRLVHVVPPIIERVS